MDVKVAPLVTLLVLTAIATSVAHVLPPGRQLHPLPLLLDLVPFAGAVVATVITTRRLSWATLPLARRAASVYGYFAGAFVGALGVAHSVAVIATAMSRARQNAFVYDFRFYALILLGLLLISTGVAGATRSVHLARGDRAAWRSSVSVWALILAINLPLAPLQGFAILFSLLAALQLLLLCGIRRQFEVQAIKTPVAVPDAATPATAEGHPVDAAPRLRVLAVGLLYPAVLGAALAWYVQALVPFYASRVYGTAPLKPSMWALFAGLWFLVYHSAWYVARTAARRQNSPWPAEGSYRYRSFASDLCDVGALLIAFVALDFVSGAYRAPLLWVVYGSMFIAASAAAIMRGSILTGLALLISATGAALHVRAVAFWPVMDWAILIAMWILLAVYISSRLGGVSHPYIDALVRTQMWGPEGTWKKSAPGEVAAS